MNDKSDRREDAGTSRKGSADELLQILIREIIAKRIK